ncbi:MAG: hypothetical protein Q8M53_13600 [Burkholderiales bacterium]|nr:hypothetical protein [Burkholderiales bacterium]
MATEIREGISVTSLGCGIGAQVEGVNLRESVSEAIKCDCRRFMFAESACAGS